MKHVGIFAGTFDPFHIGHLQTALAAVKNANLEKLFMMVEREPRRKTDVTAYKDRVEIVKASIADQPKLDILELKEPQFTIFGTLPKLLQNFIDTELYLVIGDDVFDHLPDWADLHMLLVSCRLIVFTRGKNDVERTVDVIGEKTGSRPRYTVLQSPASDISSSRIRRELEEGKATDTLAPAALTYIQKHHVYAAGTASAKVSS